jgi:galactitol-specific phosphotransferase system IIB component
MKTLVAAIVYMCISGVCQEHHVDIEQKACHIGTLHGKVFGADATFGVKCEK